jgi:sulfide:quinone oxidoreductase
VKVVVAGAGVAGLEALVALRTLADERIELELVAPEDDFTVRALDVFEPFGGGHPRRYPLDELAGELGATRRRDAVVRVDAPAHEVALRGGGRVAYDALLLAVGAVSVPAFEHGTSFDRRDELESFQTLLADVRAGLADHVAVVVPQGAAWTLPAYELALMTAAHGATRPGPPPRLTLVTSEREPLESFGPPAAAMVREELAAAGVELGTGARPQVPTDVVLDLVPGRRARFDRIVHLPLHAGPRLPGVPCDVAGFVRVDEDLRVLGAPDVWAAGDGTTGPVKQGGLAAQQADTAAQAIAWPVTGERAPQPYRPVLLGLLRTARGPRYLRADPPGGLGDCVVSEHPLWWPPSKVASRWLTPWLATRDLQGRAIGEPRRLPGGGISRLARS